MVTKSWLVVIVVLGNLAVAAPFRCDYSELAGKLNLSVRGLNRTQKYYAGLADPEKTFGVSLKDLSVDLKKELSPREVADLAQAFHDVLLRAATGSDGKPNPFAADNVKHVSLHYRDIEGARSEIDTLFRRANETGSLTDIALLNAAAHDIGKIAELAEMLSPEVKAVYDRAVADEPKDAFLLKTILGHDGLTMNGISNLVRSFAQQQREKGDTSWNDTKIGRVIDLLQAASARHNAGYGNLENRKDDGVFHFWQTMYPRFAGKMQSLGLDVAKEYPAAQGGWTPVLLAMIDRGTSLHPSFVEKIAGQGNFEWSAKSVGGLLKGNARSVREEIDAIAKELGRHITNGKTVKDFSLYQKYSKMADDAEKLGDALLAMNDFTQPYIGRPTISDSEKEGFLYYQKPGGDWYRVQKDGLLQRFQGGSERPWVTETVDANLSAASILMQKLIGYSPIETYAPRVGR